MYTVVILTKNESLTIEHCITSIPKECDVVVVDSGSTDNTVEIVKELNVRFYIHSQDGVFLIDRQRNWALSNCNILNEWVCFLDADETLNPILHLEIIKCVNQEVCNAYNLTPKYIFWGTWLKLTQGYPNWHPRLLKRSEVWIEGGVWEHFCPLAKVGYIKAPYEHYANSKGFSDWLKRHDRYSDWDASSIFNYLYKCEEIKGGRKIKLRRVSARLWFLRPFVRFFYMFFIRLGFLEGWKSFVFCSLYFVYEFMIVVKVFELKRLNDKLPL